LPVGMIYDGTTYLYEKNLQGDIIGIYTTSGTKVATYVYDAWGKTVSSSYVSGHSNVYTYNPFRYRGYYYDTETGFYYLQSRYYDPATGRFINADGYINANGDLQGFNMYAYCSNNPVMYVDYTGEYADTLSFSKEFFAFLCGVGSVGGVAMVGFLAAAGLSYLVCDYVNDVGSRSYSDTAISIEATPKTLEVPQVDHSTIEKDETDSKEKKPTYFHITTMENALLIKESGIMLGSRFEGGHIFAFRIFPNSYAIRNAGAHKGVIISFKTFSSFEPDSGINDWHVLKSMPVVSVFPGPIYVTDVEIVGVTK